MTCLEFWTGAYFFTPLIFLGGIIAALVVPLMMTKIHGDRNKATTGQRIGMFALNFIGQIFAIIAIIFCSSLLIATIFYLLG